MPRVLQLHAFEGVDGLRLDEVPAEEPGPNQVRIRVEAFALNWGDQNIMRDRYSFSFERLPARVGIEATGIVEACGPGATAFELGDRVGTLPYFYGQRGVNGETAIVPESHLARVPKGLSIPECTSVWMQYTTAYFPLVELSTVAHGSVFLVTAATGTAGLAALEIARSLGATTIGTTRYEHNRDFLKEAGADHVVVTEHDDLAARINEVTDGAGVDVAFDPTGASLMGAYAPALALNAAIYFYGFLDGNYPEPPYFWLFNRNATLRCYSVFHPLADPHLRGRAKRFIYHALAAGALKPRVDRVFPLEDYRAAFDYMAGTRTSHGKIVVVTGL